MRSIFIGIKNDAANYVKAKQEALLSYSEGNGQLLPDALSSIVQQALSQIKGPLPRIATKEEFYQVNKEQMTQIEVAQRCAIQGLVENAPLIEGEEVEEDFFSYLLEPIDGLPVNTGVLQRRTNMAEILYIFDLVLIDDGNLVHLDPPPPIEPPGPRRLLKLSFTITGKMIKSLLKTAGTKVATTALSKVGAVVLNIVMKELGMENDNEKMLSEIRKVIKEEIDSAEITKIEGTIDGTLQFLSVEYKNQKANLDLSNVVNRRALLTDLKDFSNKFYTDVIGTLKQDRYAVRGLKTFMCAAPVHLLLTQEMALVDPDYMNPNESGFLQTLRDNATIYRNHVQNAYNKAINDRNNMQVYTEPFVDSMGNSAVRKTTWWWRDNVSSQRAGQFMDTKKPERSASQNAHESLERHRNDVLNKRREELGKPQETFLDVIGDLQNFSFPKA
jgi:hypothetical protein